MDARGRVRGVGGLGVDASVIARVPSANTHLAVIALAERLGAAARLAGAGAGSRTRDIIAVPGADARAAARRQNRRHPRLLGGPMPELPPPPTRTHPTPP